ncbi:acetyl-CoA carboxylase, biotin carboxyl carrier protein [Hydrogenobacter thermophilus TK-6]|uniref:Biotin carboxyl carrier protein of acetyl-CoA carboxylase n=1 Tax=Hydrogenobacter thermophilus (strain DSM 6534 / IAM 12695 / TK-6) TaxID=608538 RepID=D3DK00_HYDTT|nr:acetyl-CoA carboxylase biotin carboxyl carrier protein [Hydrogenobacter thermophilus]ADO46073.1 acetyl-CoA carboxylase, biotin carboxyl carrier protein [Hydrogenobacter thermophilus TK-6]BAI70152.1 biotin carboxyl carrier protein [Hydrogenobacter thermophilus TK-6]
MDKDFIKEIINLVKGSDIKTVSIEAEGLKIHIETYQREPLPKGEVYKELKHMEILPPSQEVAEEKHLHVIKSPLVGTFYRSPSPGAPPFVEVGDIVSSGQVLCIIEALKVMNEIESDVRGRVVKILVENGETVEYGQPLFLIDTSV